MNKEKILIVDDESDILEICRRSLHGDRFDVKTVESGEEALKTLRKFHADILITDINMPGMGGKKLLEESKRLYPEISAAIITGHGDLELAVQSMDLGAQIFIAKPFTPSELKSAINRLAERKLLLRENLRLKTLMPLLETSQKLTENVDTNELCRIVAASALKGLKGSSSAVLLKEEKRFRIITSKGLSGKPSRGIESSFLNKVIRESDPVVIGVEELSNDRACALVPEDVPHISIAMPILSKGKGVGVLLVSRQEGAGKFTEGDVEYISILSNHLSASLDSSKLYEELEKALEDARESDRLKDAFLNNMCHEFRTPLNIIINFSELLLKHSQEEHYSDYHLEELSIVKKKGEELLSLFENIMDASTIESGSMKINRDKVHLSDFLPDVMTSFEAKAKEKGLIVEPFLPKKDVSIISDKYILKRIFSNVLDNAVKFTDSGKINVTVAREGKELFLKVVDSGAGIDREKVSSVFEKFRRADESSTSPFGGVGLGLYLTKKMTELVGGKIDFISPLPAPGKGSLFTVKLPAS